VITAGRRFSFLLSPPWVFSPSSTPDFSEAIGKRAEGEITEAAATDQSLADRKKRTTVELLEDSL